METNNEKKYSYEQLNIVIEGNRVILEKTQETEEELTFDELFKDYNGATF